MACEQNFMVNVSKLLRFPCKQIEIKAGSFIEFVNISKLLSFPCKQNSNYVKVVHIVPTSPMAGTKKRVSKFSKS